MTGPARRRSRHRRIPGHACLLVLAALQCAAAAAADDPPADVKPAAPASSGPNKFLVVPYPITEPAIGSGLLAGPVWMRDGPPAASGPSKPQAFGFGALWTNGGSRGLVAFDHRAWNGGEVRTTFVAAKASIVLSYSGLLPQDDQSRSFNVDAKGGFAAIELPFGHGTSRLGLRLFSASTQLEFDGPLPPELASEELSADVVGVGATWSRDSRDDVFSPSTGQALSAGFTANPSWLGASFDAQSVQLQWTAYRPAFGRGVLGLRAKADFSFGDPPFFLRPFVSMRGVAALSVPGEQVASVEVEYRQPVNARWDLLAFGGVGAAHADIRGMTGDRTVVAGGLGVRFKVRKLFGLTFGVDVAQGPDGTVGYVQIGNAWSR